MANPGVPVLVNPIGGIKITDNTPTVTFEIPTDADNDKLVFELEVDTHNPIDPNSSDYLKFESRYSQGSFEYDSGTGFVVVPQAGVGPAAYGKTATATVPVSEKLRNAIWYWKIKVSDQLTGALFGTTSTFGQRYFKV